MLRDEALRLRWRDLLEAAFEHAGKWLGFGAKTAVGYGRMKRDERSIEATHERKAQKAKMVELDLLSPNLRRIEEFKASFDARAEQLRGSREKLNGDFHNRARKLAQDALDGAAWTAEERLAVAIAIAEWLPKVVEKIDKDQLKKLKLSSLRGQ